VQVMMFWPTSASLRRPSSSAGGPNIAGSGLNASAKSAGTGPWWPTSAMNFAIAGPKPSLW
jgi:hypothetical protein